MSGTTYQITLYFTFPPKFCYTSPRLYGITSQKTVLFIRPGVCAGTSATCVCSSVLLFTLLKPVRFKLISQCQKHFNATHI